MSKKYNGNVLDVIPQFAEFLSALIKAVAKIWKRIDATTAQAWIENAKSLEEVVGKAETERVVVEALEKALGDALLPPTADIADKLHRWRVLYKKYFGIILDIDALRIPKYQFGHDRLMIMAKGFTPNQAYDVCAKLFPCSRYRDDLDKATEGRNVREATETYAIWIRDRIEADEENKDLSANQLATLNHDGMTVLERILLELIHWDETGEHLDIRSWTMCHGSRDADGSVLYAGSFNGGFHVGYADSSYDDDTLRSRLVVF